MDALITVGILAVLAGVVAIRSGAQVEEGRIRALRQRIEALQRACEAYHADTGAFAYEYSGYAATHRKLSGTQTTPGWSGPYLDRPLAHDANPFGGQCHLYRTVTANGWIRGFDLDGDGAEDVTGDGNMLYLSSVEEAAARELDEGLDGPLPGPWNETGRLRYDGGSKRLWVLVHR